MSPELIAEIRGALERGRALLAEVREQQQRTAEVLAASYALDRKRARR